MRCGRIEKHLILVIGLTALFLCGASSFAQSQTDPTSPLDASGQLSGSQGIQSDGDQSYRQGLQQPKPTSGMNQGNLQNDRNLQNPVPSDRSLTNDQATGVPVARVLNQLPPDPLTEFQRLVQSSVGQTLPIYGARLFMNSPSTFAPLDRVPVTPDYVIGPGDELLLQAWGQISLNSRFTVDRAGDIFIPQVGTVHTAGLPFSQLQSYLKSQMSRVFRNFDLSVTMGQLRSIQIFVLGQARRPGSYTVSSLSTLVDALFVTGGPSPQGSLRHIQLKRSGKVVVDLDLYDLLLRGDKSNDAQLLPGDVIYIPTVGPQVAIAGSVNVPAIYELKAASGTTVEEGLAIASGPTSTASGVSVRLERIDAHQMRSVSKLSLDPAGRSLNLRDGDILEVDSVTDQYRDGVTLRGNVANPGHYAWKAGMRLKDLFPDKDALVTRDYWLHRGDLGKPTLTYIPSCPPSATGNGSTGLTDAAANCTPAEEPQRGVDQSQTTQGQATQGQLVNRSEQPKDSTPKVGSTGTASSLVDNVSAGFETRNTVTLSAPDIDWSYAVIERQGKEDLSTSLLPFNLGRLVLDGDESQNLELQPGDVVTIFSKADIRVPQSQQTRFVRLEGEFVAAGVYSVHPGETLQQLVARSGGLTKDAYLYGSEFTRESTRRLQQERLNQYIDQVSLQAATTSANRGVTAADTAEALSVQAQNQSLVASLRQARSSGRIVLSLSPDAKDLSQVPPIALEDGDMFIVPSTPLTVSVSGAVYNPNSFVAAPNEKLGKYLGFAGGPNRLADAKHTYVIRADGSVISRERVSALSRTSFKSLRMYPGDTIVVPLNLDRGATLRTLVDVAQIVGQFGLAAAAAAVVF